MHHVLICKDELQSKLSEAAKREERRYLLDEVHAFRRLHSICIVNYMRDVIFGTQSWQLLEPARKRNKEYKWSLLYSPAMAKVKSIVMTSKTWQKDDNTCQVPVGQSRKSLNEHTGWFQLRALRFCVQLPPNLSATRPPRVRSPRPRVQSLTEKQCFNVSNWCKTGQQQKAKK